MSFMQSRSFVTNHSKASELFRYLLAGGAALLVHLLVLSVLVEIFEIDKIVASAVGFICATPVNYILQKIYVFKSTAKLISSFSIYCIITILTLILNTILFWLLLSMLSLHYTIIQVVTVFIIFNLNYYLNRNFTFINR